MSTNYDADVYDAMHPGSLSGDVEWYRRKAVESGGPVLELGAGTGRVSIPIAEAGVNVTAVDLDPGMLGKLTQKVAALPPDAPRRIVVVELSYLYPSDIKSLLAESGFELTRISGDVSGRPFERDGDELVVEARKP